MFSIYLSLSSSYKLRNSKLFFNILFGDKLSLIALKFFILVCILDKTLSVSWQSFSYFSGTKVISVK